jgi:hypothetical protein
VSLFFARASASNEPGQTWGMSTSDQTLSLAIHETAMLLAQDERFQPLVSRLTAMAGARPGLRAEAAGMLAGRWFAGPEEHDGYDLIAAGLTILAGAIDRHDVARWVRAGYAYGSIGAAAADALAGESSRSNQGDVPTPNARLLSASALLLAHDESLQPLLDRIGATAGDRPDLRAEVAGTIAGYWFAGPDRHHGHELIAAGLTLVSGDVDQESVARWVRVGYQRGTDSTASYDPSR